MSAVETLLKEINSNLNRVSASAKDEVEVMRAMMNDMEYKVTTYPSKEQYCPSEDIRKMCVNVISSTANITKKEATDLVNNYEFTKSDATSMVNFSKEYVTTYMKTGRKLPLGGREDSNVSLQRKEIKAREINVPNASGNKDKKVANPAYVGIKASNKLPSWKK